MDISTLNIAAHRLVAEEKSQLMCECELFADTKPAIDSVLKAEGRIIIDSKEVLEDRISYKGRFIADILYLSKDNEIKSLEGESAINDFIELKDAAPGMSVSLRCNISNIDWSEINDRKVSVRAMADIEGKAYEKVEVEAIEKINDLSEEQQRLYTVKTEVIGAEARERFKINEEITLPNSKPSINDIISVDTNIINPDFTPMEDMVEVRGDIAVTMLYSSDEGAMAEVYEFDIPFNGSVDVPGARENMSVNGTFDISEVFYSVDENSEGENRVINMEALVFTELQLTEATENEILEDAYSINQDIKIDTIRICTSNVVSRNKSQYPVKEIMTLSDEAPDMLQIFKTGGRPYIDDIKIYENKVVIEGIINVDIMYITGNDQKPVYNYNGVIPFSQTIDARGAEEGMKADVSSYIAHMGFNMLSDREVEVRCALNTNTVVIKEVCYNIPVSAEIHPLDKEFIDKLPGFVLYTVKKGDTLWKLAKRFNSTIRSIAEINNIENPDLIYPGQRFLIAKEILNEKK